MPSTDFAPDASPSLAIRRPTLMDLPAVRGLYAAMLEEQPANDVNPADLDEWMAHTATLLPDARFVAAVATAPHTGQVIAYTSGWCHRRPWGTPRWVVVGDWIYVAPAFRQQHIAHRLFAFCAAPARAFGCTVFEWGSVLPPNTIISGDAWSARGYSPIWARYAVSFDEFLRHGREH